ncbi:MAG: nitroreductase family protein, partial [Pseudomonadota bacterium]
MNVSDAVATRISTRAFNDTPLSERDIRDWLTAAQRAPSGGNVQPWRVIVVTGAEKDAVVQLAGKTLMANPAGEKTDRPIYPKDLGEPYMERRRAVARQMYEKLGIAYDDKPARNAWM